MWYPGSGAVLDLPFLINAVFLTQIDIRQRSQKKLNGWPIGLRADFLKTFSIIIWIW